MFYHLNKSIAHCASPPTWQVLLSEVPFILLTQKEKAFSVWFSSPQPPPHCFHASPPTWQVLLLVVPFILLIWKEKASSFWFSSPQPPPLYFHASPPTCQVILLDVPFILLIWKEITLSFYSSPTPPPFPSPTTHLSSLPYEKRIINQPNAISLLIVKWLLAPFFFYDFISLPKNIGSSILINVGRHKNYLGSQTIH